MNITVYLGASKGNDNTLANAVRELGTWIGESGNSLVYGGSKSGLMGEIAESVLRAGGKVTGVEPQFFIDAGFLYEDVTNLIVTNDMSERKAKMIELGDAFIAFPGGTGTLEEIAEIMSKVSLGHLDVPCRSEYNRYPCGAAKTPAVSYQTPTLSPSPCSTDSADVHSGPVCSSPEYYTFHSRKTKYNPNSNHIRLP